MPQDPLFYFLEKTTLYWYKQEGVPGLHRAAEARSRSMYVLNKLLIDIHACGLAFKPISNTLCHGCLGLWVSSGILGGLSALPLRAKDSAPLLHQVSQHTSICLPFPKTGCYRLLFIPVGPSHVKSTVIVLGFRGRNTSQ